MQMIVAAAAAILAFFPAIAFGADLRLLVNDLALSGRPFVDNTQEWPLRLSWTLESEEGNGDDEVALSSTGHGELFIAHAVGATISAYITAGMEFKEAVNKVVHEELPAGTGGVVAVSPTGEIATPFNSGMMNRGWIDDKMVAHTAQGEDDLGSAVLARDPLGMGGNDGASAKL